ATRTCREEKRDDSGLQTPGCVRRLGGGSASAAPAVACCIARRGNPTARAGCPGLCQPARTSRRCARRAHLGVGWAARRRGLLVGGLWAAHARLCAETDQRARRLARRRGAARSWWVQVLWQREDR